MLGLPTRTVRAYLIRCGGIRPNPRHRGVCRLSVEARGDQPRPGRWTVSAEHCCGPGASPSTISRELAAHCRVQVQRVLGGGGRRGGGRAGGGTRHGSSGC